MSETTERLALSEVRKGRHPNLRPRDASSLILVERRAGVPNVLMGRRSQRHVFYPGAFVFPGGRVDRADGAVPSADEAPPETMARLMRAMKGRPSERRARALPLAALRETFEEAGILLGVPGRREAPAGAGDWLGFFDCEVVPALSPLAFVARAITPPRRSRRFDTRFFAAEADAIARILPPDQRPTDELSELVWLSIDEAKGLEIPNITRIVLDELATRLDAPGGLKADLPVPFYHVIRGQFVRDLV